MNLEIPLIFVWIRKCLLLSMEIHINLFKDFKIKQFMIP